MNIVLLQPEIPQNTGAIGRTCLAAGCRLHLVHPLGFFINAKTLQRSGMDYWEKLDVCHYDDFADFMHKNPHAALCFVDTFAAANYNEIEYAPNDFLIFGGESKGISPDMVRDFGGRCVKIPMAGDARSLNLSVSVGIVLYEALRQNGFCGLR
ncbi:MAG: tRNA (cytidine(34)-2'-O)-methyltransferase [Defluviitaleaceae bacterium]|nr:tRNA (cytidine(34)-2'-O)-methyltransferase [Defluviitaleaceae bacterium]